MEPPSTPAGHGMMAVVATVLAALAVWVWATPPGAFARDRRRTGLRGPMLPDRSAQRTARPVETGLLLELAASLLEAGQPVPSLLAHLGDVVPQGEQLTRVGRALELGLSWERAWAGTDARLIQLARALGFAHSSGAAAAQLIRRAAVEQRRAEAREAQLQAARLAVRLVVPLGLCALPAFICWGIVPLVVSMMPDL
ncbi:type II secretion system F family protein [Zhihengliuella flava]|uniref:type II secretion system F family protein n=1 Tax=Zhihengliuella flava TaxID=1285193 RepID=UPI0018CBF1AD